VSTSDKPARIRVDVRLKDDTGFRRHFEDWQAAVDWMASSEFLGGTHNMRSIHLAGRGEFPGTGAEDWIAMMARKSQAAERGLRLLGQLPPIPRTAKDAS
jgi:hypothetical protein